MKDEEFDRLLKMQMQEDEYMPEKINQLFSNFESEVNMKENKKTSTGVKISNFLTKMSIAACVMLVTFVGGCTYAHVNGIETIISPVLRKLGLNGKYEENATQFNDEVIKKDVKIKLVDGAIDDVSLIVGYEIEIENNNPDAWIEVSGEYKINDINVKPINTAIDKLSDTSYIYYQVFDVNEIKIENPQNVKINANIFEIKEFTESEELDSVSAVYGEVFSDEWNFEEVISLKNLEDAKEYEFTNPITYEILPNVYLSIKEFITGSYTSILKVQIDKTKYQDNHFELYYKILDEQNREVAMFSSEEKQYDYRVYNDRLIIGNLGNDSKIGIEVYLKMDGDDRLSKIAVIPAEMYKATEKVDIDLNLKQYQSNDYSFKYNETWNLTPVLDANKVGPNSIYLGALELEIPSTTNSVFPSHIYVKVTNENTTMEEYAKQIKDDNNKEYYVQRNESEIDLKNNKGYQITAETSDGETIYVKQDIFTTINGKVFRITFFGSEKDYNNLNSDILKLVSEFEVL